MTEDDALEIAKTLAIHRTEGSFTVISQRYAISLGAYSWQERWWSLRDSQWDGLPPLKQQEYLDNAADIILTIERKVA